MQDDLDKIRDRAQQAIDSMTAEQRVDQIGSYLPIHLIPTLKAVDQLIQQVNDNMPDDMDEVLRENFNGLAEAIETINTHIVAAIGLAHPEIPLADLEKQVADILLEVAETKDVQ